MRIEQLKNNIYIKSLDNIDAYLVNIINRYFQSDNTEINNNIENIINQAVKRMKDDLDNTIKQMLIKNSVTSVNGNNGDVMLSFSDVNAEECFDKNSAFNKSFGDDANTVCEGNDYRLSDARVPIEHEHDEYIKTSDLNDAILSVLSNIGFRVGVNSIDILNKDIILHGGELSENHG